MIYLEQLELTPDSEETRVIMNQRRTCFNTMYPYCTGACKHEFATMLQLRDILAIIKNGYPFIDHNDYLAAVSKTSFFEFVIDGNTKGTFTMG